MTSTYHLDPSRMSIGGFEKSLSRRELIPSRRKLKDGLAENFRAIVAAGIAHLGDLLGALKTKDKIDAFARRSGVDAGYLTLLKREAGSYLPKPYPLNRFPGVDEELVTALTRLGLANTKQLFDRAKGGEDLPDLCEFTGASLRMIEELFGLCDLSRLYGVGPAFARILYDVGITSVEIFKNRTAAEMVEIYEQKTGKKADFGEKDLRFSLEVAELL